MRVFRVPIFVLVSLVLVSQAIASNEYRWDGASRVVAFSDVHGAHTELVGLLTGLELIDEETNWIGGDTHLVSTGDLLDRGADSRKVMDLLMKLQEQAPESGGQVHVTLGNHEIMNMYGDLRYVIKGEYAAYADDADNEAREAFRAKWRPAGVEEAEITKWEAEFDKKYPPGFFTHRKMFAPDGHYGKWLLERPFVIVVNGIAFTHGGLGEQVGQQSLEQVNTTLRSELIAYLDAWLPLRDAGIAPPGGDFWGRFDIVGAWLEQANQEGSVTPESLKIAAKTLMTAEDDWIFAGDNPLWYRDMVRCHPLIQIDTTKAALKSIGAERVVVGHTPTGGLVRSRFNGSVIQLDTGMAPYYGGRPSALIVENGQTQVYYADDDSRGQPVMEVRQVGRRPNGLGDDDIQRMLLEATVAHEEDVGSGITKPTRVTLEEGDVKIRALFRTRDDTDASRPSNSKDTFKNDIAAYELDRLLGLDLIPVTVLRRHDHDEGIFQFWVENSITELERNQGEIRPSPNCLLQDQYNLMYMFDVLIYNEDRNQSNILYQKPAWDVVLIDHSRAFRAKSGRPAHLQTVKILVNDEIVDRLNRLTPEIVNERLSKILGKSQIKTLLRRKDQIIKDYKSGRK